MSRVWPFVVVPLVAMIVGAGLGRVSFARLDDPRPMCGTCHHTLVDLTDLEPVGEPPHRTELGEGCHGCHVVPLREYVQAVASFVGADPPAWAEQIHDPSVGGQTCLGCHVGRGRGVVQCDRCHADGGFPPALETGCEGCHLEAPMHPHAGQPCRTCHVGTTMPHQDRTRALMRQKLSRGIP